MKAVDIRRDCAMVYLKRLVLRHMSTDDRLISPRGRKTKRQILKILL